MINGPARVAEREELLRRIARVQGTFLHALPLADGVTLHNFSLTGTLTSSEYASVLDDGLWAGHRSIRDTPMDELSRAAPQGVYSPLATWRVWAPAIIRNGGRVGVGAENTQWLEPDQADYWRRAGDLELAFERARRDVSPDSASRLTSLFVVEDSNSGRELLDGMFGRADRLIVKVSIPAALRMTRHDVTWYERYWHGGGDENLKQYWRGSAFSSDTRWEYLVEGAIELSRVKDRRRVQRELAARPLPGMTPEVE